MNLPQSIQAPTWWQQIHWILNPIDYMQTAAQRYGDRFITHVEGSDKPYIFVSHPEAIQQILSRDTKEFSAPGESNQLLKPFVGDRSIFLLDPKTHRTHRKLLIPPFHGERIRTYANLIGNITQEVMDRLSPGDSFVARSLMQEISIKIILQAVFGLYEGDRYRLLAQRLTKILEFFNTPIASIFLYFKGLQKDLGPWSPWGNFIHQRDKIDELLFLEIAERRQSDNSDRTDILSLLIAARDEAGNGMSDRELRDELLSLLFAGHETTATALSWSLYWAHFQPEIREKILAELKPLGSSPEPLELSHLPYLTAVCKETLRIYPVAMLTFPRKVEQPIVIQGDRFEPNSHLLGCIYLTHQREDLYPEPQKFKPERFLERQYSSYEYLPFGGGVRRCIGYALAQLEMNVVLGTILSGYSLELAHSQPVLPERRGVTLAPKGGVKMIFQGHRA
jgi:unspecific monooxygenase